MRTLANRMAEIYRRDLGFVPWDIAEQQAQEERQRIMEEAHRKMMRELQAADSREDTDGP